jgi:hypothetical protein
MCQSDEIERAVVAPPQPQPPTSSVLRANDFYWRYIVNSKNPIRRNWIEKHPTRISILIISAAILFVLMIGLACNQPGGDDSLRQTQIAINVQATQLAMQQEQPEAQPEQPIVDIQATQNAQATQTAQAATLIAQNVQETIAAQQATEMALTANAPTATFTETPSPTPTETPTETEEPPPQEEQPPPAQEQPPEQQAQDFETMMQDSKILLYEDITKLFEPRYVKEALDSMGLSRNYTDVKDATGEFKTQLLSGTDWDLIIVAVEARTGIQGEFFAYILEQLNKGASVIMEHWNLDDLAGGQAAPLLTSCGLKVSDWWDPPDTARSLWPLFGEHPIWHEPNEGMSLANYSIYWYGDVGDFLKKIPGSDAILLAGHYAQTKDDYATLATCMDGRFILQTFCSHDYHREDVVRLWQNYIYNALKARFVYEQ